MVLEHFYVRTYSHFCVWAAWIVTYAELELPKLGGNN